jgi:hypothetical protein
MPLRTKDVQPMSIRSFFGGWDDEELSGDKRENPKSPAFRCLSAVVQAMAG